MIAEVKHERYGFISFDEFKAMMLSHYSENYAVLATETDGNPIGNRM
jgi:hypothetical protein